MGRFTQKDPIGLAGGVNQYGYASGDPVGGSDPFGLKVCFEGNSSAERQRLADSTMAATGTSFTVVQDASGKYCAENVRIVNQAWAARAQQFIEMANDPLSLIPLVYDSGGSGNRGGKIRIDQNDIGGGYFVRKWLLFCTQPASAVWSESSIISHELGHLYAVWYGDPRRTNTMAFEWENAVHSLQGAPKRARGCGDHP
jgi:hypothetical protein